VKLLGMIALAMTMRLSANAAIEPIDLRCENLVTPIDIQTPAPRLSWALKSRDRGARQTAYRIQVCSVRDPNGLEAFARIDKPDLWDSGKVASDETLHIPYAGKRLASGQQYLWLVTVWDEKNKSTFAYSGFEMGLLDPSDWHGRWIGRTEDTAYRPAPLLRKSFGVRSKIKRATIYICGLGYHELSLNGKKVGDHHLDPGYTRFDRRALYAVHDVTKQLRVGKNAVGVILGTGWLNVHTKAVWYFDKAPWRQAPKLLMEMRIEYEDGSEQRVVTDRTWKTAEGPIVYDSIYGGETYDARREIPGWDTPGFNDSKWDAALDVKPAGGKLVAQQMPPIRKKAALTPVKLTEPKPGVFIYDLGQNLAGHARFTASGPAGAKIKLRYGEKLKADGTLDTSGIDQHQIKTDPGFRFQTDEFILRGAGTETFEARFTYHGFQYVEVTGFPGKPTLDNLRAVFVHTDVPPAGAFECSNDLLNKIQRATRMAYFSNLQSIPTDCPHREKNGWTGDAHLAAEQALLNFAPAAFNAKWINDLDDEMRPTGELPGIVPSSGWGYEWGNGPAWDSAFLLIPWYTYLYTADTRILTDHYPKFKRYVDYLTTRAKNGIVGIGLGDWVPYKTVTPEEVTSTGYYYVDTKIVAETARLMGNHADARKYSDLAVAIRKAFNAKFFKPETASYSNGGQTALSCALYQGFVEPQHREKVLANLVAAVEKNDSHIDTGILGAKYLLNALLENGRADVAYRIASQRTNPSWGWWIDQGATTLWESWPGANDSRNHIMFGDISAWFYKALGGIRPDPAAPGFKRFTIQPEIVGDLKWVKTSYRSARGTIVSNWAYDSGRRMLVMDVAVPPNTTATIHVPCSAAAQVTETGRPLKGRPGIKSVRNEAGHVVVEAGGGYYRFFSRAVAQHGGQTTTAGK
jgi:alpha-L-rhamnosidase